MNGQAVSVEAVLHKGYAAIKRECKTGDVVRFFLPMPIEGIYANPNVLVNAGKVALQRGPVVYCLEQADNGAILPDISLPEHAALDARFEPDMLGGVTVITGEAVRGELFGWDATLYAAKKRSGRAVTIKAIPYFAWANQSGRNAGLDQRGLIRRRNRLGPTTTETCNYGRI
ncbi:hypothetical protein PAAL109150_20475 [Paenibacillus alkaliterrae]|uniref:hypothetical protein n=1 Tax=Paenibacillus alkaliterrae TaxID=320909 RepID=UPI002E1FD2E8